MSSRNIIISIVLNVVLLFFVGYLAYFKYIQSPSDEYRIKIFPEVSNVVCSNLVERAKNNISLKKDYLYKWCNNDRYEEVLTVPKVELNRECTSDYFGITINHNDYWKCTPESNTVVLTNSVVSLSITISNSNKRVFCVEGKDDGCSIKPFLETEFGSFLLYQSSDSTKSGEIYGRMPGLSQGGNTAYANVTFYGGGSKIGDLNEYQQAEIKDILRSIDIKD